jgi:hypothetical protein
LTKDDGSSPLKVTRWRWAEVATPRECSRSAPTRWSVSLHRRRTLAALLGLIAVVVGILVARNFVYVPLIDNGAAAIHDPTSVPARIHVCGRAWNKDALDRRFTEADINDQFGAPPTLVDPRLFAPCPTGACTATAGGPCATVIFVRVGEDAYVDYSLSGGP